MKSNPLYHYTSSAALVNILNHGYLRATQAWHLADGSECRHAIDSLRLIDPGLNANGLWKSLEKALLSMPRYVVCFSTVRNDTYQWKNYGEEGAGACIVYDPFKAAQSRLNSSWSRFECQYDQSEQKKQLEVLVGDLIKRGDSAIPDHLKDFWKWNIQFKREDFSKENEIRYVFTAQPPVVNAASQHAESGVGLLAAECANQLNSYSHSSGFFDERFQPFEPFCIHGAITEIILGSRFTATSNYWKFLSDRYDISQI